MTKATGAVFITGGKLLLPRTILACWPLVAADTLQAASGTATDSLVSMATEFASLVTHWSVSLALTAGNAEATLLQLGKSFCPEFMFHPGEGTGITSKMLWPHLLYKCHYGKPVKRMHDRYRVHVHVSSFENLFTFKNMSNSKEKVFFCQTYNTVHTWDWCFSFLC